MNSRAATRRMVNEAMELLIVASIRDLESPDQSRLIADLTKIEDLLTRKTTESTDAR